MAKKRILWVSEASFLATGFSVLTKEILDRLYKTGKYEIAELGAYARTDDPRAVTVPWIFYGGVPLDHDKLGHKRYTGSQTGQFGEAVFEQVCLDFKPDIVVDVRDHWMCEFQLRSPYRPYYKLVWMPTVDGEPQRAEWLDDYKRADLLLTYSKYGKDVLERETGGQIKVHDIVSPGVDTDVFKPMDKQQLRTQFGINPDWNILMTVMRNQKRKLYPDLIEMFAEYLRYCVANDKEDLARNSYLYLHTSYPDVGFDIARHILDNKIGHKVLVTYCCKLCGHFGTDFFQTELTTCKRCGNLAAHMPNTGSSVSREAMAKIMNLADLYIQYSICEGFGMPIAESKACGVPALGVDYSATSEQVNVEGCSPIKVEKFFHESLMETEQKRALPDNSDAVVKVFEFFNKSKQEREKLSDIVRQDVLENASFDRAACVFEKAIDSVEIHDRSKTWDNAKPSIPPMRKDVPQTSSNAEFIDWCIDNIIDKPELKTTSWKFNLIKDLNIGFGNRREGRMAVDRESVVKMFMGLAYEKRFWELERTKSIKARDETSISWKLI